MTLYFFVTLSEAKSLIQILRSLRSLRMTWYFYVTLSGAKSLI